jgi:hypothetical protein
MKRARISTEYRVKFIRNGRRSSTTDTNKREAIRTARRGLRSLQDRARAEVRTREGALIWQGRKDAGRIVVEEL